MIKYGLTQKSIDILKSKGIKYPKEKSLQEIKGDLKIYIIDIESSDRVSKIELGKSLRKIVKQISKIQEKYFI